jgi:hypothetical protein
MNRRQFLKTGIPLGAVALIPLLRKLGATQIPFFPKGKRARYFRVLSE